MMRLPGWMLTTVAVVAVAGCGTTVPMATQRSATLGDAAGLEAPNGLSPQAPTSSGPAAGAGTAPAGGAVSPSAVGQNPVATDPGTDVPTSLPTTATLAPVQIGVLTEKDAAQAANALGASGLSFGNTEAQVRAIVADLNRRGGLRGHKVVPVFHDVKTADANSNPAAAQQAACEDWTRDHHVVAAINSVAGLNKDVLFSCLAKAGVPLFLSDLAAHPSSDFTRYATSLFGVGVLASDRVAAAVVPRLVAQQYFTGWDPQLGRAGTNAVKVGVLYLNRDPAFRDVVLKQLKVHGINDVQTFGYDASLNSATSQMSSAELQFASRGVTHVLIEEASAALFFLPTAESQHYRPRYGLQSLLALNTLSSALPKAQFGGAIGIGWSPFSDVTSSPDTSPAAAACRRLMQQAGDDPGNRSAMLVMSMECDVFAVLSKASQLATDLTPQAMRIGVERVGVSVPSTFTFGLRFAPDRHDSISAIRDLRWDGNAFVYGPTRTTT